MAIEVELRDARRAGGSIIIGGIDILASLESESILGYSYTDNEQDQADDLTVEIADPNRTWMQSFLPEKGVQCSAEIRVYDWAGPGDTRYLPCGTFTIDQIDFKGPPNVVGIKGTSVPIGTGIKTEQHFMSWENVPMSLIVSEIAEKNGLITMWEAIEDPMMLRVDQVATPDLEFVRDLAKDNALSLRIFDRQMILFSEKEYDARPPVYVIKYGASQVLNYSFSSKLNMIVAGADEDYVVTETGQNVTGKFEVPTPPTGTKARLVLNERLNLGASGGEGSGVAAREAGGPISLTAAEGEAAIARAAAKARARNKKEFDCTMQIFGNPSYVAGLNVELVDWGLFDGMWHIESTVHTINSSGYTTELKMRQCLVGY